MADCEKHGALYEMCPTCAEEWAASAERARIVAAIREGAKKIKERWPKGVVFQHWNAIADAIEKGDL